MRSSVLSFAASSLLLVACATAVIDDPSAGTSGTEPTAADEGGDDARTRKTCTKTACANGDGFVARCETRSEDDECVGVDYEHDGQVFSCASCDDCDDAEEKATASCDGTGASSSSGGSSSGGPNETCTAVSVTCEAGGTMQTCTTTTAGTCSNIRYTYGGSSYSCGGCSSCTDVYYEAYTACQGAVGACSALASCCTTISSTYKTSCQNTVSTYQGQPSGDVTCHSTLKSYQSSGLCP